MPRLPHPVPAVRRRGVRALALAGVGCAVLTAAAHAAPTTIATEQRATPVAAWAGTVAWSSYDLTTNEYHLVVSRNGGAPQRVPVAPSAWLAHAEET